MGNYSTQSHNPPQAPSGGAHPKSFENRQTDSKRARATKPAAPYNGKPIDALEAQYSALRRVLREGDGDKIRDLKDSKVTPQHFQEPNCQVIAEVLWYQSEVVDQDGQPAPIDADSIKDLLLEQAQDKAYFALVELLPKPDHEPRWEDCVHTVLNWKRAAQSTLPSPVLTNDKGHSEYAPRQIVALLYPDWRFENIASHAAHARRIRDVLGDDLRYCPQLGWLRYTGKNWEKDDREATATAECAASLGSTINRESGVLFAHAATLARDGRASDADAMSKAATSLLRHAKQVETRNFIDGALHLAAGDTTKLRVKVEAFDQKPWIIGFQNFTWDKGHLREHRREDHLMHLSPVALDLAAPCDEWLQVLKRITGGDNDLALTLQDAAGYILSGASHLRFLPWAYGPKGTGKSTYAELLKAVLGPMAATIDPKKLEKDAARERLGADLWNRRLAICAEAGSQRIEAEILKTLSGSDSLPVRFLYKEAFDAAPRHVLLMVANDAPRLDAYDDALRDRVVALPFAHALGEPKPFKLTGGARIEAVRQDPNSPLTRGFAAWAVEGLARVFKNQSIHRAACIEVATAKFWADTDPLTLFWETVDKTELVEGIAKGTLRSRYELWCDSEGARPFNRSQWARACESHGLEDFKGTGGARFWRVSKIIQKVAQVAQLSQFSENLYERKNGSREVFENNASCATCATNDVASAARQKVTL